MSTRQKISLELFDKTINNDILIKIIKKLIRNLSSKNKAL